MKKLVLDDLTIGQAVTIMSGPCETVVMPPVMLQGEDPPVVDTAVPGRVFMIEALDMNTGLIMLKALDGGGPASQKMTQMGPIMAFLPEQNKPDTFMYNMSNIVLAAVSQEWLTAYVRNFCAHKGVPSELSARRIPRKARTSVDSDVAVTARIETTDLDAS